MRQDLYDEIVAYIIENQEKFYRLAFSYVRNKDDALDVVQNAICKALDHYESLRNPDAVRTWFYRILVNESIQLLNKQKREIPSEDEAFQETPYYEKGYEAEDDIYEQIGQLDTEVQTIIKLRFFEELSLKEIADVTKLNLNTVKTKLYRGLKQLKQSMQEVAYE